MSYSSFFTHLLMLKAVVGSFSRKHTAAVAVLDQYVSGLYGAQSILFHWLCVWAIHSRLIGRSDCYINRTNRHFE